MGKSEEELLSLPPIPSGYKLTTPQVSQVPELPPIPEGYRLQVEPQKESQFGDIVKDTLRGVGQDLLGGAQEVFEGAKNVLGMVEAPYSIATGLAAFFPSWLTGIFAQAHPDIGYEEAEKLGQELAEKIVYQPKTEIGQLGAQTLGKPFVELTEGLQELSEKAAPGDPESQSVFRTLAWFAAIFAAPTLKSGVKQSVAAWKAKGKVVSPEVLKTIVEQEFTRVAKEQF